MAVARRLSVTLLLVVVTGGCSGGPALVDAGLGSRPADGAPIPEPDAGGPDTGVVDAATPDARLTDGGQPDAAGANCHVDCFGTASCSAGVVTLTLHAPVPCEYWRGSCPVESSYTCQRGCAPPTSTPPGYFEVQQDPSLLCQEGAPKHAGDACASEDDCRPTQATPNADGSVTSTYLTCDLGQQRCVAAPAPVVADWLSACGPAVQSYAGTGDRGAVPDETCRGGACVFADDQLAGCLRQGCSAPCTGDQECPPGAVCDFKTFDGTGVCKPGARNSIGYGLSCP